MRRGRCPACRRTHALLPDFVHARRLDAVEVIGAALELGIAGLGMRAVAIRLGLAHSTARDWRRRHRARAPAHLAHLAAVAVSLGAELRDLPTGVEAAALHALGAISAEASRFVRSTVSSGRDAPTNFPVLTSMLTSASVCWMTR